MRIGKEPARKSALQGNLDFDQGQEDVKKVSEPKDYLDYTEEEKEIFKKSIRAKHANNESLTKEELDFQVADEKYWQEGDQYRH